MTPTSIQFQFNKTKKIKKALCSKKKNENQDIRQLLKLTKENTQTNIENIQDKDQFELKEKEQLKNTLKVETQMKITDQRGGLGIPPQRLGMFNFDPQPYEEFLNQSKKQQSKSKPRKKKNKQKQEAAQIAKIENDPTQTKIEQFFKMKNTK